ncbi:signal transduction histidine kinase [Shimia isoporae]|uniref:histidine kinase n=1 Tax=Shimia isoporae TaxID=647720 RepID=A0A4R1NAA9_9RHOB|nr:ATP-binding protein [Shimia isoporae]TCL00316.1 signal transduction histidine kinase [Shimia isoporae]
MGILLVASLGAFFISTHSQRATAMRNSNAHDLDKILVSVAEMSTAFEQIRVNPMSQRSEVDQARVGRAVRSGEQALERVHIALEAGQYSESSERVLRQPTLSPLNELEDLFFLANKVVTSSRSDPGTAKAAALAANISRQVLPVLLKVSESELLSVQQAGHRQVLFSLVAILLTLGGMAVAFFTVLLPTERYVVSSQEEIEAGRQEALAASQAKSLFLATMSHEIRTPLNGVLGLNQLLLEGETDPERRQMLSLAVSSGQSLHQIINDILDLSKIEAGKLELERADFDVRQLCQEVGDLFAAQAKQKGIVLKLEVGDTGEGCWVSGFAKPTRQVVLNLVNNAVKFTDSGSIVLRLEEISGNAEKPRMVRISVQDTGIGISEDALDRVFDQFEQADASTTTRFGGTGLGLAIVKRLAEAMGGDVDVESTVGCGSTFSVVLPVRDAAPRPVFSQKRSRDLSCLEGRKVLVVDDNRVNRLVATKMLERLGCVVLCAEDGIAAVKAEADWRPELVLMDVRMPGIDGLEATRRIHDNAVEANRVAAPIVGLSANAMEEHREEGLAAGMDGYLTKPLKREALEEELLRHLNFKNAEEKENIKCA